MSGESEKKKSRGDAEARRKKPDRRPILKRIESKDDFHTTYKGHEINVNRCHDGFCILVEDAAGTVYDGFVWLGFCDNMADAVKEALRRAKI